MRPCGYDAPRHPLDRADIMGKIRDLCDTLSSSHDFPEQEQPYVEALYREALRLGGGYCGAKTSAQIERDTRTGGVFEDVFYSGKPRREAHTRAIQSKVDCGVEVQLSGMSASQIERAAQRALGHNMSEKLAGAFDVFVAVNTLFEMERDAALVHSFFSNNMPRLRR